MKFESLRRVLGLIYELEGVRHKSDLKGKIFSWNKVECEDDLAANETDPLTADRLVQLRDGGGPDAQLGADRGQPLGRPAEAVGLDHAHLRVGRHGDEEAVVAALVQPRRPVAAAERVVGDAHHAGAGDGKVGGRVAREPADGAGVGLAPAEGGRMETQCK